jgi:hypothetical protein
MGGFLFLGTTNFSVKVIQVMMILKPGDKMGLGFKMTNDSPGSYHHK